MSWDTLTALLQDTRIIFALYRVRGEPRGDWMAELLDPDGQGRVRHAWGPTLEATVALVQEKWHGSSFG